MVNELVLGAVAVLDVKSFDVLVTKAPNKQGRFDALYFKVYY